MYSNSRNDWPTLITSKGCVASVAIAPALAAENVCNPVDVNKDEDPAILATRELATRMHLTY